MMKSLTIVVIVVCSLYSYYCEKCIGGRATSLPENCRIIEKNALLIGAESDESLLYEKLMNVEYVTSGIEVTKNSFDTFDFLENVVSITNPSGPAIKFVENRNLKRIVFPKLAELSGTPHEILFSNDNFPHEAYQNEDSMQDFQVLQRASQHGNNSRNHEFFAIFDEDEENTDQYFMLFGVLNLIAFLFLAFTCLYWMLPLKKILKSDKTSSEGPKKNKFRNDPEIVSNQKANSKNSSFSTIKTGTSQVEPRSSKSSQQSKSS